MCWSKGSRYNFLRGDGTRGVACSDSRGKGGVRRCWLKHNSRSPGESTVNHTAIHSHSPPKCYGIYKMFPLFNNPKTDYLKKINF